MENDETIVLSDTAEDYEILQDHSWNRDDVRIIYESGPSRRRRRSPDLIDLTDEGDSISYPPSRSRRRRQASSVASDDICDDSSLLIILDDVSSARRPKRRSTRLREHRSVSSDIGPDQLRSCSAPLRSSQSDVDLVRSSIRGRCPICLEDYGKFIHEDIYLGGLHVIDCGHLFCKSCILAFFGDRTNKRCPICRAPAKRSSIRRVLL